MNDSREIYQEWGRKVIGKTLIGVEGVIYIYDKLDFLHPQKLKLIFCGVESDISFRCGNDGATLEPTNSPLRSIDLQEYGKEMRMNMSASVIFQRYINKRLSGIFTIYSSLEESTIGLKLIYDNSLSLFIVNFGDEINIFNSLEWSEEQEECFKYFRVA